MSVRAELERQFDGPIPAALLEQARYPTLAHQIERAKQAIIAAKTERNTRLAQWQRERTYARYRGACAADFEALASVHSPHVQMLHREQWAWARQLVKLEARNEA